MFNVRAPSRCPLQMAYLLQNDDARQCLASILRQPQAKGPDLCLSDSSFDSLAATLQTMLQCCHHVDDYVNATGTLSRLLGGTGR